MKNCLIVDDSRVIRKVSRHIVETLGFEQYSCARTKRRMVVDDQDPGTHGVQCDRGRNERRYGCPYPSVREVPLV